MIRPTVENAMVAWEELALLDMDTDREVNDLLEEIAGEKYRTLEDTNDPIYLTIYALTNSERRRFLKGCEKIREKYFLGRKVC